MARNVPLAEATAEARQLDADLKSHGHDCPDCKPRQPCQVKRDMAADLRRRRREIRTWFAPGPDQEALC